jgi:hypothetical protein
MKFLSIAIVVSLLCSNALATTRKSAKKRPCDPLTGDATAPVAKDLNKLKNRSQAPSFLNYDLTITIQKILAPGNDSNRFSATKAATITGYVASVKPGGIETCNCHATDPAKRDTHIDLVADAKYASPKIVKIKSGRRTIRKDINEKYHMIVEVTPRVRSAQLAKGIDWSTATLNKQLMHHWVRFSGWMLFDLEHVPQAENTNPGGKSNWRATCTEIHPVFAITVIR